MKNAVPCRPVGGPRVRSRLPPANDLNSGARSGAFILPANPALSAATKLTVAGTESSNPSPSSGESIANLTSSERGDARARRGCQSVSNPTQSSYLATLGRRPAAELGIIAEAAGHEIARRAHVKYLDLSAVRAGLASIGAITGVRSTPTPAAALRRAGRRHLRGVSQKGAM